MERELTLTRLLNAPRALVYQAWTECTHFLQWWGPRGFSNSDCSLDVRVGGKWAITMNGPGGVKYPCGGVYREVVDLEKLAFTNDAVDLQSKILLEGFTTVTLAAQGNQTQVTVHTKAVGKVSFAEQMLAGMEAGWNQSLDKFTEHVTGQPDQDFVVTRVFDAPRELVFKAFTEAERLSKWWGPKNFEWISGTLDLKPGGVFHYGTRAPNGGEMWGKFVYRDIIPPQLLVFTSSFSDAAGNTTPNPWLPDFPLEVLNVVAFNEASGKTTVNLRGTAFQATPAQRQAFIGMRASMDQGFAGTFASLEAYLDSELAQDKS